MSLSKIVVLLGLFLQVSGHAYADYGPYENLKVTAGKRTDLKSVIQIYTGTGWCSASIVGENVILTAAHCIKQSPTKVSFFYGTQTYEATVYYNRFWNGAGQRGFEIDAAVGIVDRTIQGAKPWNVVPTYFDMRKSHRIHFAGYGCTDVKTRVDGGLERTGSAPLKWALNYTLTIDRRDLSLDSQICFGDSGGPGFLLSEDGRVSQVGIVARTDPDSYNSYFANINGLEITNFIEGMARDYSLKICGINTTCDSRYE